MGRKRNDSTWGFFVLLFAPFSRSQETPVFTKRAADEKTTSRGVLEKNKTKTEASNILIYERLFPQSRSSYALVNTIG